MPDEDRPTREKCIDSLEFLARRNRPFVIRDWDGGSEGFAEAEALARSGPTRGTGVGIVAVPAEHLPWMSSFLPASEIQAAFLKGRPLLCYPVRRVEVERHPSNRPMDTPLVSDAKSALEISTFTLAAQQYAVELSRNSRNRSIDNKEARYRAESKVAAAVWHGRHDRNENAQGSRFHGLLDRGRRRVARFFGFAHARDVMRREAAVIAARLADGKTAEAAEADIRRRGQAFAGNEVRAVLHERAMYRWNRNIEAGRPIDAADLIDIVNGLPDRQTSSDLMRVAVAADLNPADTHRNFENMREEFELGRRIGRLMRGAAIEISKDDAVLLAFALHAARQSAVENKPLKTEADACKLYLADAAMAACPVSGWWLGLINRILASAIAERVSPADFPKI